MIHDNGLSADTVDVYVVWMGWMDIWMDGLGYIAIINDQYKFVNIIVLYTLTYSTPPTPTPTPTTPQLIWVATMDRNIACYTTR